MRRLVVALALVASVALPHPALAAGIAASWPVGHQPFGVAIDPTDGRVYVANSGGSTVSVVQPASGAVSSVVVGSQPGLLAVEPVSRRLYVSNSGDQTLSVVNLTTMAVSATVFGAGGLGVAVNPAVNRIYVAGGTQFVAVNTTSNSIISFVGVPGGQSWFGVAVDPSLHRVYVTNIASTSPSLEVLDDRTLTKLAELSLPKVVRFAIAVDPTTHAVYLGSEASDAFATDSEFYVVDATTLAIMHTTPLGRFSGGIALKSGRIFVTDMNGRVLRELDDQTFAVTATTALPWQPALLAAHPDGRLYVAGSSPDVVAALANNSAPTIDSVSFSPMPVHTDDLLQASVVPHDPEGDTLTLSYEWSRNGAVIPGATTAGLDLSGSGAGDRDDTIALRVTASDGQLSTTANASIVVADSAPTVSVALNETSPTTNALLTATATASDPDGDSLTYTFKWQVNGVTFETATGPNPADGFDLSLAGNGDRGDTISVQVTASDGTLESSPASAAAVIANSAPVVAVSLSDATPRKKDVLVATATGDDADGDPLTFTYVWRLNGEVRRTTTISGNPDSFDLKGRVANGDVVAVTVTAADGTATSVPAAAGATVSKSSDER